MTEPTPVFPPQWYADRVNANRPGLPPLSQLDPLLMSLWHIATEDKPQQLISITGI